jgi:hypothetical protein
VIGPQNRLTQDTGVDTTTMTGRPAAMASATVAECSSGSGSLPSSPARESMTVGGTSGSPGRVSVRGAGSPGAGTRVRSATSNAAVAHWVRPSRTAVTSTSRGQLVQAVVRAVVEHGANSRYVLVLGQAQGSAQTGVRARRR